MLKCLAKLGHGSSSLEQNETRYSWCVCYAAKSLSIWAFINIWFTSKLEMLWLWGTGSQLNNYKPISVICLNSVYCWAVSLEQLMWINLSSLAFFLRSSTPSESFCKYIFDSCLCVYPRHTVLTKCWQSGWGCHGGRGILWHGKYPPSGIANTGSIAFFLFLISSNYLYRE